MELKEIKCTIETVNITIALNKDSVIRDEIAGIFADGYQIFTGKPYIGTCGKITHISGNHREYIQKYSLQNINSKWIARYATCVSGNNYVIEIDENTDLTEQLRAFKDCKQKIEPKDYLVSAKYTFPLFMDVKTKEKNLHLILNN